MIGFYFSLVVSFFSAFLGGYLNLQGKKFSREWLKLSNGFSAGLLITISLAHMLPEAELEKNYIYAVAGFGIFYLIEGFTKTGSCSDAHCPESHPTGGIIAWSGMSFHALVDGIAMGVGFGRSLQLGFIIAAAIMIHKAPIGFSLTGILASRGYKHRSIILMLLIFSLLTPLGALVSVMFLEIDKSMLFKALAFSGGTFLHISVSELLPDVHAENKRTILYYVLAGILTALLPKFFGL
ncbi:MAG: ZIP family metal transporter [Nitrospirae bacterium]|nr:ZIP family metal transporter [Nitrospirota bacterium]